MLDIVSPKLFQASVVFSVFLAVLLVAATSFEFLAEEMAKVYVVPILTAATFIAVGNVITLSKSFRYGWSFRYG